jgi:transcriptional regulator with XRE-family HTH domain
MAHRGILPNVKANQRTKENQIQSAARELRARAQFSQQLMAQALGLSMGAVRNYESGAITAPDPRPLYAYRQAATNLGHPDLAIVFRRALSDALSANDPWDGQLQTEPTGAVQTLLVAAVLASLTENGKFSRFREPVLTALRGPMRMLLREFRPVKEIAPGVDIRKELELMGLPASWLSGRDLQ